MVKTYAVGELWPLTFNSAQRRTVVSLCDVMIPADETSPSASSVGVPDFIDEWVSAPYPAQKADRPIILKGLAWIETEAQGRFGKEFSGLNPDQQTAICDDICDPAHAKPAHASAVRFFKRYRDLTAGGYYTTAAGMKAIGYREFFEFGTAAAAVDLAAISERIKLDTRRYAKRQMTFFRKLPGIEWISPDPKDLASRIAAIVHAGSHAV